MLTLQELLTLTIEKEASDMHIIPGYPPTIRVHDELFQLKTHEVLESADTQKLLFSILEKSQIEELEANKEIDFGFDWTDYRFRINYYSTRKGYSGAFRVIPSKIKTLEDLGLPNVLHSFADYNDGLVLLTGPTGEGKSTTIASILNEINLNQEKHIITIEDPIEFTYGPGKSIISQREINTNTHSWVKALRSALREDPDVVLIGEMRDYETIQSALTIAETGHLVFSTLHTSTTPEAINRIIDVFPANQQAQVRHQLSTVLRAVVSQRLVPKTHEKGRVPALEILINVPSVASLIREQKYHMITNTIETGEENGMILFEKYLASLYRQNRISKQIAYRYAERPEEIKKFIP